MRGALLSSMMVQDYDGKENRRLLEKYQPDIVRDVPEGAIGSPEHVPKPDESVDIENPAPPIEKETGENQLKQEDKEFHCFCLVKNVISSILKPTIGRVVNFRRRKSSPMVGDESQWEINMDDIDELHWIGSGAQGAVFLGKWKNQEVAIKKVQNERDTDIKHLRHLDHQNIVKFRYVKIFS